MHTKNDLKKAIETIGIEPTDTLLIHSSMKAVGQVENGAETVLDAFIEYLKEGLLIFPTHSWATINEENNVYNPATEPSCVGVLSNLFMKKPGVLRSWHPSHSVAALGKDAAAYVAGEEKCGSPCPREGCWGKLYDRQAKILFLGCSLKTNTYIHGVEEWNHIPLRLSEEPVKMRIVTPDGGLVDTLVRKHQSPFGDVSKNYDKMEEPFLHLGIAQKGKIGDAQSVLCDAVSMADLTSAFLKMNPNLFEDNAPVPEEWYKSAAVK